MLSFTKVNTVSIWHVVIHAVGRPVSHMAVLQDAVRCIHQRLWCEELNSPPLSLLGERSIRQHCLPSAGWSIGFSDIKKTQWPPGCKAQGINITMSSKRKPRAFEHRKIFPDFSSPVAWFYWLTANYMSRFHSNLRIISSLSGSCWFSLISVQYENHRYWTSGYLDWKLHWKQWLFLNFWLLSDLCSISESAVKNLLSETAWSQNDQTLRAPFSIWRTEQYLCLLNFHRFFLQYSQC